jgi:hypothetical protein
MRIENAVESKKKFLFSLLINISVPLCSPTLNNIVAV